MFNRLDVSAPQLKNTSSSSSSGYGRRSTTQNPGPLIIVVPSARLGNDGVYLLRQRQCRIELFQLNTESSVQAVQSISNFSNEDSFGDKLSRAIRPKGDDSPPRFYCDLEMCSQVQDMIETRSVAFSKGTARPLLLTKASRQAGGLRFC